MMGPRFAITVAVGAACVSGAVKGIEQIEHIVIFMQENRAFDHYYGMLDGVRGFSDRAATLLPSGLSAFFQPSNQSDPANDYILPFPANTLTTSSICMDAPTMEYFTDLAMWNGGRVDSWNTARAPGMGMSYMTRADLPYYYALYDQWVAGDQYHQSSFTCTNPNRMHLFTGSNGISCPGCSNASAVIDNTEFPWGYDWATMGEVLENASISWKVYQQADNFDDNAFAWFAPFISAQPGSPLYDKGMARVDDLIAAFDADMAAGTLPQVSWIVGPANLSEHASYWPSAGEDFAARVIATVGKHPDVYAKMAFILNYDEGGQFFDHAWTPTPPMSQPEYGLSTVTTDGEITNLGLPIGLGFRVPLLVISPWSRGHGLVSEVFDHTSVIKLIEKRFNVSNPNISPWRRAVAGDLLSAFNFSSPDYSWPTDLPDTSGYVGNASVECHTLPPPEIPAKQTFPQQEAGTRFSRALPYAFLSSDSVDASSGLSLTLSNVGAAGSAFMAYDFLNMRQVTPKQYAVEAGKSITDTLPLQANGSGTSYGFAVHGPNGWLRAFMGDVAAGGGFGTRVASNLTYVVTGPGQGTVRIALTNNDASSAATFTIVDNVYGTGGPWTVTVQPGRTVTRDFNMASVGHWYDFTVSADSAARSVGKPKRHAFSSPAVVSLYERRFMGRMETGVDTISDPAMAQGKPGFANDIMARMGVLPQATGNVKTPGRLSTADIASVPHPDLPERFSRFERKAGDHKDAQWAWEQTEKEEL